MRSALRILAFSGLIYIGGLKLGKERFTTLTDQDCYGHQFLEEQMFQKGEAV